MRELEAERCTKHTTRHHSTPRDKRRNREAPIQIHRHTDCTYWHKRHTGDQSRGIKSLYNSPRGTKGHHKASRITIEAPKGTQKLTETDRCTHDYQEARRGAHRDTQRHSYTLRDIHGHQEAHRGTEKAPIGTNAHPQAHIITD